MYNSRTNQPVRPSNKAATHTPRTAGIRKSSFAWRPRILLALLLILVGSAGALWALNTSYSQQAQSLSEQILLKARQLRDATNDPVADAVLLDTVVAEMRSLVDEYEQTMAFARSPYQGEILLGTTPPGESTWLETLCTTPYRGLFKEIRIRRTGSRSRYLRINDIEITGSTPKGPQTQTFNKGGMVKLYSDGVFQLALPAPMSIRRIRININHESTGLAVYGIPYYVRTVRPTVTESHDSREILLGTTTPGDGTWLETLCNTPLGRPIRQILLKRTGSKASYLRINDIELTYLTPKGPQKEVFNKNGRFKLYRDGVYTLSLPKPMMVTRIRVLVDHESTGLQVYGVY